MIVQSRHSYNETLSILRQAIADAGNTIFADIDQSGAAAAVGLALRPTTLLVFGNPRGGTPLMDAYPEFALELPLKILVWEGSGGVELAYTPLKESAAWLHVTGMNDRIEHIDAAVEALLGLLA